MRPRRRTQKYPRPRADPLEAKDRNSQARSQEFEMRGLFWRLESTSNDLDPDFDRSSLRMSQFFCLNLGDLQKKKKRSSARLSLSGRNHIRSLTTSYRQYHWGEAILFSGQKSALKMLKTGYFAYSSGQWGAIAPSSQRYWECSRPRTQAQAFPKIYLKFLRRSPKKEHKKGLREFSEMFLAFSSIMLTAQKILLPF